MIHLKTRNCRSPLLNLLIAAVLMTLVGCQSQPKKRAPSKSPATVQREFEKAQTEMAAGDSKKALRRFEWIIKNHPESDIADDAAVTMGQIHFSHGDFNAAYSSYMSVVNSDIFSSVEADALLGAAKSLYRLGRLDESLSLIKKSLSIAGLSPQKQAEFYQLRFQVATVLGDKLEAIQSLAYLSQTDPDQLARESHRNKMVELIESRLNEKDLEQILGRSGFESIKPIIYFRLGQIAFEQRDFRRSRDAFSQVISAMPGTGLAERAKTLIDQIDARGEVHPKTIGAVLPLTGRHASVGYRALRGLQLGLGIYGRNRSDFKLAVIDSEGNADQARRAVERLVTEDHVIAIVGSLMSKTAVAVASKANELGIPSIALSQKAGLTDIGPTVFRNALTSERQMEKLVHVAMDELGLKRFAILFPNDSYGVEYANLFWDEVALRGGKIIAAQPYNPEETSFVGPVERLVGTYYKEDRQDELRMRLKEWSEKHNAARSRDGIPDDLLPPIVEFDAVFIPDTVKALSQVSAALAYGDIQSVRLLGTNVWNSQELAKRKDKLIEGAVFVDSLSEKDPSFQNSAFFKEFRATFGEDPGLFEVQGYDSGLILRTLIAGGARTRIDLMQALAEMNDLRGSLGPLKMSPGREVTRPMVALTLNKDDIVPLEQVANERIEQPTEKPSEKRPTRAPRPPAKPSRSGR